MTDDERELVVVLEALAECVRELTLVRWNEQKERGGKLEPTIAEKRAREILALYQAQFAYIEVPKE